MKKLIAALLAAISLAGCTSFLNVENLGKSSISGFFMDIDGLKAAGLGLHRLVEEFYDDDYIRMGELAGDNLMLNRVNASLPIQLLYDFASQPSDNSGYPYYIWKDGYEICTNANNILYYGQQLLENHPDQEALIKTHFGYAYFARALAIFDLCNVYAMPYDYTSDASHPGVVAIDYVPGFDSELPRNTVAECYKLVISDLEKGIECFGEETVLTPTYFSGLACKALLARVYLYMKDYDNAARYAREVMDVAPALTDADDYVNMFRKAQDVPGEGILRMNSYGAGSGMRNFCSPISSQTATADPEFVDTFAADDVRRELFIYIGQKEDGEQYEGKEYSAICKYLPYKNSLTTVENRRCDPFILRTSEMYLIHAEALCLGGGDLAESAADIKALRARALGKQPSEISLNYSGATDLDRIIREERAKELCYEGHRFFDLKRRGEDIVRSEGSSSTLLKLSYPDYRYVLPISQLEIQANDQMVQNEKYE